MRASAIIALALSILAFGIFSVAMAYPWPLAVLAATAVGAFAYSTQNTWARMRRLARPPEASDLMIGRTRVISPPEEDQQPPATQVEDNVKSAQLAPGEDRQGESEQQM